MENNKADMANKVDSDGYPFYPVNEDVYKKSLVDENVNPENTLKLKGLNEDETLKFSNEKDFKEDELGGNLDVPGTELDDKDEAIGNEDEENNYYSLGGDNHNVLDENSE